MEMGKTMFGDENEEYKRIRAQSPFPLHPDVVERSVKRLRILS